MSLTFSNLFLLEKRNYYWNDLLDCILYKNYDTLNSSGIETPNLTSEFDALRLNSDVSSLNSILLLIE